MYYPEEIVEEVRSKNDIVDIVSGYVHLKKRGGNYVGICPFHNEKTGSFTVSQNKQMYHCFGCGAGGNVFTFIMNYDNATFKEAIEKLADRAGVKLPEVEMNEEQKKVASEKAKLLEINKEAAKYFFYQLRGKPGENGLNYFKKRELSDDTMKQFGLGYSLPYSDSLIKYLNSKGYKDELIAKAGLAIYDERRNTYRDKFWNRVMFPIQDANHRVIAFGGRVMGDGEPKYLNSPETPIFDKSKNLYGLNFARSTKKNYFILCEGYMDVIAMHQAGFNCAVASLGTAFTSGQANIIKRYTDNVILSYDSDAAGTKAALRAIGILKEVGITARVLDLKPHKDPDEFIKAKGVEAFEERIEKSVNSFYFEIEVMGRDYNMSDPEEKTKFYRAIAKKICEFPDEVERNNYTDAVCERYGISNQGMKQMVVSYAGIAGGVKPIERPKSGIKKADPDEGKKKAQRLLITWISEEPFILQRIEKYISADDFTDELYHKVAIKLFDGIREGNFSPASFVSMFDDEEDQKNVALLFNTKLTGLDGLPLEMDNKDQRQKAFNDILGKVKANSIEFYSEKLASDVNLLTKVIAEKKLLEELKHTIIKID